LGGCKYRDKDLLYASASPSQRSVLFLSDLQRSSAAAAALWLANHAGEIKFRGQLARPTLLLHLDLLGVGCAATMRLSLANLLAPGQGLTLWQYRS